MKSPRFRSSLIVVATLSSFAAFACGSSDDDTGLTQAIGGSAGSAGAAKGGGSSKGGSAGTASGKGGSTGAGCGDLLACCISLANADDKSSCQATAAALADSADGAAQCQKALAAYQAQGLCEGGSPGKGGSGGKGGAGGKSGAAGKSGTGGKGGTAGKAGASAKGGNAGAAGEDNGGAAGEDNGGAGGDEAGGQAGDTAGGKGGVSGKGGTAGSDAGGADAGGSDAGGKGGESGSAGATSAGAAGEAQGGAGQGGSAAGTSAGGSDAGSSAGGTDAGGAAGSSAGQGGAGGGPVVLTREAACESFAQAFCTKADSCGGAVRAYYRDVADCVARVSALECNLRFTQSQTVPWTPDEIAACAVGWNVVACGDAVTAEPPGCAPHKGTRTNGQYCIANSQCASGFCTTAALRLFPDVDECGVCRNPLPTERATANCFSDEDCTNIEYGLLCDDDTGACRRPRTVGQSCATVACAAGLYCSTGASPTCKVRGTLGSACTGDFQCSGSSRFALYCVNSVCSTSVRGNGAGCASSPSGASGFYCAGDGDCDGSPSKCVYPVDDGSSCEEGFPPFFDPTNCRYPATCVSAACTGKFNCTP